MSASWVRVTWERGSESAFRDLGFWVFGGKPGQRDEKAEIDPWLCRFTDAAQGWEYKRKGQGLGLPSVRRWWVGKGGRGTRPLVVVPGYGREVHLLQSQPAGSHKKGSSEGRTGQLSERGRVGMVACSGAGGSRGCL